MDNELFEQRKRMIYDFICDELYVPMKLKELAILMQVPKRDRADLDFAVAAREQHDHAVVFALLADAPCVDEVGGVIRRVLPVEEIHDDGDGLNAGCVFERRAILRDGIEGRAGKHRTVVIIRIGKFARLFRYGGRSADGQRQHQGQRRYECPNFFHCVSPFW